MTIRHLFAALLLFAPVTAAATTFNEGDVFTRDFSLPNAPSGDISSITSMFEFQDNGFSPDEVILLELETDSGVQIFSQKIEFADTTGGVLETVGAVAAEKTSSVNPALVTGSDYSFTLTAQTGSFNITSFKLQFFEAGDPNSSGAGGPFNRKPSPTITWGNGDAFAVPLPSAVSLLLAGLAALGAMRLRRGAT